MFAWVSLDHVHRYPLLRARLQQDRIRNSAYLYNAVACVRGLCKRRHVMRQFSSSSRELAAAAAQQRHHGVSKAVARRRLQIGPDRSRHLHTRKQKCNMLKFCCVATPVCTRMTCSQQTSMCLRSTTKVAVSAGTRSEVDALRQQLSSIMSSMTLSGSGGQSAADTPNASPSHPRTRVHSRTFVTTTDAPSNPSAPSRARAVSAPSDVRLNDISLSPCVAAGGMRSRALTWSDMYPGRAVARSRLSDTGLASRRSATESAAQFAAAPAAPQQPRPSRSGRSHRGSLHVDPSVQNASATSPQQPPCYLARIRTSARAASSFMQ